MEVRRRLKDRLKRRKERPFDVSFRYTIAIPAAPTRVWYTEHWFRKIKSILNFLSPAPFRHDQYP